MTTINHECYISLEVAKLLKEAGFDWGTLTYYPIDDKVLNERALVGSNVVFNHNRDDSAYSAPSLSVAQRWLREVKEIEVNTLCVYINNVKKYSYSVFEGKYNNERIEEGFDTFEEALEAGIKKCLTLILEK